MSKFKPGQMVQLKIQHRLPQGFNFESGPVMRVFKNGNVMIRAHGFPSGQFVSHENNLKLSKPGRTRPITKETKMSKNNMLAEANKIEKSLSKLSGKKLQKARFRMYNLRYRAKKGSTKPSTKKVTKKTISNDLQGLLPGFVEIVNPTAQELARDFIFKALRSAIQKSLENLQAELKKAE